MLKFNLDGMNAQVLTFADLNTSNVKVQQWAPRMWPRRRGYLNTSNVKVQLLGPCFWNQTW